MNNEELSLEEKLEYDRQIKEWKDIYGDEIYLIEIKEEDLFIYRALSKKEFDYGINQIEDIYEREEYFCSCAVLEPEDFRFDDYFGFVASKLAEEIVIKSGFNMSSEELDKKIEEKKNEMSTFTNQIVCIIHDVFPEYEIDDIEDWTLDKILTYYGKAHWILKNLKGVVLEKEE